MMFTCRGAVDEGKPLILQGARECGGSKSRGLGGPRVAEVGFILRNLYLIRIAVLITAIARNRLLLPLATSNRVYHSGLPPAQRRPCMYDSSKLLRV